MKLIVNDSGEIISHRRTMRMLMKKTILTET